MALLRRLEAYYNFNGGSGIDLGNGGHDLTNNGTNEAVGILGSGIEATAASLEYMSIPVAGTPYRPGDTNWSFGIWIKMKSKSATQRFLSQYNPNGNQRAYWLSYATGSDRIFFTVFSDGTNGGREDVFANSFGSPTVGDWMFVYCIHDAANNRIGIQINNGPVDWTSHSTGVFATSSEPFVLGAILNTTQQYSDSFYDQFGFWHRILSPQERTDLYGDGTPPAFPFSGETSPLTGSTNLLSGLRAYWNFDEQGQAVREDLSGNGYNLSPRGTLGVEPALVGSGVETFFNLDRHLAGGSGVGLLPTGSGQSFTIYSLIQLNNPPNGGVLFSKDHAASGLRGIRLRYSGVDNQLQFFLAPENNAGYSVVTSDTISAPTAVPFYHVFCWYDADENSINMEINGSGINTTVPASGFSGADVPFFVCKGFLTAGSEEFFPGIVDEMGVWNRALTGNERNRIFNNGSGLPFSQFAAEEAVNTLWLFT